MDEGRVEYRWDVRELNVDIGREEEDDIDIWARRLNKGRRSYSLRGGAWGAVVALMSILRRHAFGISVENKGVCLKVRGLLGRCVAIYS